MPDGYQPILMAAEWTLCTRCFVPVRRIDQGQHDAWVHPQADLVAQFDDPALAS